MTLEVHYDEANKSFRIKPMNGIPVPAINDWPGWRRYTNGAYCAPAWPSSIIAMTKTVHPLRWTEEAAKARDEILALMLAARDALSGASRPFVLRPDLMPTERRPRRHQVQAVLAMRAMGWRVLLADDMGLGKTSEALWAAHDAQVGKILVICPVSAKFNWQNEIALTLGDSWHCEVIDGTSKQRAQQLAEAHHIQVLQNRAIVINYDLLRHLSEEQLSQLQAFAKGGMLLIDESHYCKSRDSERTKLVTKISASALYVIAMTGTPIRNLADDLYPQVEIVRPGTWTSYRDFAKRHLVIQTVKFGKRDVQKIVGVRNLDALNAVMNTLQIKRSKSDVLDLPPKVHTFPELQLEGDHLKLYKAMKDFAKIELQKLVALKPEPGPATKWMDEHGIHHFKHGSMVIKGDQIDAAMGISNKITIFDPRAKSAVEQAMRCEQIANGFVGGIPQPIMDKLSDVMKHAEKIPGRPLELMFPSSPKVVWLLETIESVLKQGGAPIVYSRFNAPIVWLATYLNKHGIKPGLLHGGLSSIEKFECVQAFQNKKIDVLLVQVKIAEGWNATRCQDVIFWSRDWSPAINAQAEDRAHRMGQTGTVNVQVPMVRNTIEAMIHKRLMVKGADAEQALRNVTIEDLIEAL